MSASKRIMAEIPWHHRGRNRKNSDISNEDAKKENWKLFLFNASFPYFIPQEFHAFDGQKIRERCPDGQYWAVASLFLIYNNSHTLAAWQHKFSKDFEELCRPSISTQMLSEIFPSPIPTCDSAANFLLDSGVLVQLPFKPVLLHQWLVAAYHEMLLFETEMLEFFFLPFPESQKVHVDDMTTLLINLDHQIRWGFNFLNAVNKPNDTSTIERFDGVVRTICKCLAWLLLPLGGSDGYRHIRNLKVNCWYPGSINEKTAKTSRNYAELSMSKRNFVYNSWWWRMPESKRRLFGRSSEDRKEKYAAFYLYSDSLYKSKSRSQFRKCVIEMGMIDKESVNFKDVFNSRGILGNICILEAKRDFKLLMLQQCGSRDPNSLHEFVLMANKWLDGETSDESDHECGLSVTPIEHCDEGIYNALKKILINWGEPINQLSLNFFDYITASFQKRLQKLVFGTISAQYKMPGSKKDDVGRDWNMGYLLSCFVASSLDLNESPAVDGKLKIWYMNFIDRLITEYETDGFEKLNNYCVSDGIDKCSALFALHFMKKPALLLSYFKTIEKAFLAEMEGAHNVIKHFKKYHLFGVLYESLEFSEEKTDLLRKPCIPWMWQLLEFFKKMERALRCCATEKSILNDPFSTDVTEDQMIELIKLMWISGTDQNAFRSNVSGPAEILHSLFFENSSSHLLELSQKFKLEAKMLPPKNILRIAFDMALYSTGRNFEFCPTLKPTCSPLDMAFHSFLTKANHGQMWALREFASKYFGADSVIHSDHSSSEDNICYFIVQNLIGWDKKVKLKRDSPLWFFPIENCRECGSVRPVAGSFLPCGDCFHGKYPDLVVYCSEDCKNEASIAHQQEHQGFEQFKSSKIGLNLLKF